jgi:hypothetical protein
VGEQVSAVLLLFVLEMRWWWGKEREMLEIQKDVELVGLWVLRLQY